ncbi:MAG: DUF4394 domain-containing protein [Armatimonadota bacterium]
MPRLSLPSLNKTIATAAGAAVLAASLSAATSAQAQIAFALRANFNPATGTAGANLISFNVATPTILLSDISLSGATSFVDTIDFRVTNGVLYGYAAPGGGQTPGSVYTINTTTGLTTLLPGTRETGGTSTNLVGMDFNPTTGTGQSTAFRVVSAAGENLVYTVAPSGPPAGLPGVAALQYAAGDPGASSGMILGVVDNAYTNNFIGATTTQQYGIDYQTDSLVTIANNAGTLTTVGGTLGNLGVTINKAGGYVGFDIFSTFGAAGLTNNTAYALLDVTPGTDVAGTLTNLYSVNLTTGAATSLGRVGGANAPGQIYSLAVTPQAVAPEPGSLALLLPVMGAVGMVIRRRTSRKV